MGRMFLSDGESAIKYPLRPAQELFQVVIGRQVFWDISSIVSLLGYFAFLQQNSLVAEIIKMAAVGLGGFGGGYGFARWRGRR